MPRIRRATNPEEHKRQECEYADAHAEHYVWEMHKGPWPLYRLRAQDRLYKQCARPTRVLDVGCGPVPSMLDVYDHAERYVCLDQSPHCLRRLREQYPRAETVLGDAESLSVAGPFDLAILFGVLHHVPDARRVVDRVWDLLDSGCIVAAMEPNEDAEPLMDSPNEQGIPDSRFDELYSCFQVLDRWQWVDASFWVETLLSIPPSDRPRLWEQQDAWIATLEKEQEVLSHPGRRGSMNFLIARKP